MENIVIVSATRTAVGSFNGALANVEAVELGKIVIEEALKRAGIDANCVDEVIMGNVLQAGLGRNPARQALLRAGVPDTVPAFSVNKVCGSGLKTIALAAEAIAAQNADIIVAGGMEDMSLAPYVLDKARWGFHMGNQQVIDTLVNDGLTCATNHTIWVLRLKILLKNIKSVVRNKMR